MNCNQCGTLTKVIDSRTIKNNIIRRRHKCLECAERFTTLEINIETLLQLDTSIADLKEKVIGVLDEQTIGNFERWQKGNKVEDYEKL